MDLKIVRKEGIHFFHIISLRIKGLIRILIAHVFHPLCQMAVFLMTLVLKCFKTVIVSVYPAAVLKRAGALCLQDSRTVIVTVRQDLLNVHPVLPVVSEVIAVCKPLCILHVRVDQRLRRFLQLIIRIVIVLLQFFHPDPIIPELKREKVISFPSHDLIE